jgi:arylsulfatase A-like enzyme
MSIAALIRRLKELENHPLSPAPLVVVCVGYWMPLEWMIRGESTLGNSTWMEGLHVVAASALINFFLAALAAATSAYVFAGLIFLLFRIPFRQAAKHLLEFLTYLTFLACSARELKFMIPGPLMMPGWLKAMSISILVLGSLWLARKNFKLMQWMLMPKCITLAVMPLALILLGLEIVQEGQSKHNIHKTDILLHEMRSSAGGHPDIILITVDTLSASHLHTYGYRLPTSPHLDDFSSNAILFENFYANANWTRPGIASILNGAGPWTHRGDFGKPLPTVTDAQNLLNRLADGGYDIRTVSSNAWADIEWQAVSAVPTHRDVLYPNPYMLGLLQNKLPSGLLASLLGPNELFNKYRQLIFREKKTREYVPQSKTLLQSVPSNRPFFFWLHIISPHGPYATQEPYLGTFESSPMARTPATSQIENGFSTQIDAERERVLTGRYDEAVLMADDVIGQFLDLLKIQGLFDRSLIVVTADHGESFHPLYSGHGGPLLTEDLIRVPCMIKPPFYHGAKREPLLFEQSDVTPTILSMANLPIPASIEGKAYASKQSGIPIFSMNHDLQLGAHTLSVAIRDGDWKYVLHLGRWKAPWPQRELYDIAQDPKESTNLVEREPGRAESMRQLILRELARHGVDTKEYQP